MEAIGYIKIWRELFTKPIWVNSTPEQKTILITLLSMANFKENEWEWKGEKYKCKPGQFVTSLESIAKACGKGVTVQNVKTAIKRFKKFDFLTNESTNTGRLITIVNWGVYQGSNSAANKESNNDLTKTSQRGNKQANTYIRSKKDNNEKKDKEIKEENHSGDSSPYREIISYFCMAYKQKYNIDYVFAKGKDGTIISNLLKAYDMDFMKEFIDWFFQTNDDFISQNRNIGMLQASKDKFIAQRQQTKSAGKTIEFISKMENMLAGGQ
ncbi:MAG: hypothetical protein N2645_21005 [Clostridia bacterium]|nr:hypothetical protein [Clostridia bacterium]